MAGLAVLALAYVVSHFYRSFLAVLSPALTAELGLSPDVMSAALGYWFVAFGLSQFPVGWLLDRVGPKRTTAFMFALGAGGGAVVFAMANGKLAVQLAMVMLGIGCAPVLMASVYIFRRSFRPELMATLTSSFIAVGLMGNIVGTLPLAWLMEAVGWRAILWGLVVVTLVLALCTLALVQDPPRAEGAGKGGRDGYLTILAMPHLWPLLPILFFSYAVAGGLRGIWAGPYLTDVHGLDAAGIGSITFTMALAMAVGSFVYGPLDRIVGSRKLVVAVGLLPTLGAVWWWWANPGMSPTAVTVALTVMGFGMLYGVLIAQATATVPDHLAGRAATLINFFNMGGVGFMQLVTAQAFSGAETPGEPLAGYQAVLTVYAVTITVAWLIYLFSRDVRPASAER